MNATAAAPNTADDHVEPGRGLFRRRGWIPLLVLGPILVWTAVTASSSIASSAPTGWIVASFALGALGLTVRAVVIGWAPPGTSGRATRVMRADSLTTDGAYATVRHPLYLGNALLWLGVAAFAAGPVPVLFAGVAFLAVYVPIVRAEEAYLEERFGEAFRSWAARTAALVPRPWRWVRPRRPYRVGAVLMRDHHAVLAFVAATWAIVTVRSGAGRGAWSPELGWWVYLAAGVVAFAVLDTRARRSRRRARSGRPASDGGAAHDRG